MSKTFHYIPVKVKHSFTDKEVLVFKFPEYDEYDECSEADVENLQQFELYFGVNEVISSINDIIRTGTNKINNNFLETLLDDYHNVCKMFLKFASSLWWAPLYGNKLEPTGTFSQKLTPERAIYKIEPTVKVLLLAVQTKMDLMFPTQLVKKIARLEIEKESLEYNKKILDETEKTIFQDSYLNLVMKEDKGKMNYLLMQSLAVGVSESTLLGVMSLVSK